MESAVDDTYSNLALEEAILRLHRQNRYFLTVRFWRNPKSVIVGRGQRLDEEVNLDYCKTHHVTIARRMTGGGAVYHDQGNLNTSLFIPKRTFKKPDDVIYVTSSLCELFVESIRRLGVPVTRRDATNITYKGRKVSGAASYFTRNWVQYHATLLHDADLETLRRCLKRNDGSKRGSSKYTPTINLDMIDLSEWRAEFTSTIAAVFGLDLKLSEPSNSELNLAEELRDNVYSRQDWINEGRREPR